MNKRDYVKQRWKNLSKITLIFGIILMSIYLVSASSTTNEPGTRLNGQANAEFPPDATESTADNVNITPKISWNITNTYTYLICLRMNANTSTDVYGLLGQDQHVGLFINGIKTEFSARNTTSGTRGNSINTVNGSQCIAGVSDGLTYKLYRNGTLLDTDSISALNHIQNTTSQLQIGGNNKISGTTLTDFRNFTAYRIAIWSTNLSAEVLLSDYQRGMNAVTNYTTNLEVEYNFNLTGPDYSDATNLVDLSYSPPGSTSYNLTLHVNQTSPTCSDAYNRLQANNTATSFCNITTAFTHAIGGDTIQVHNGTYKYTSGNGISVSNKDYTPYGVNLTCNYPVENCTITSTLAGYEVNGNNKWTNISNSTHTLYNTSLPVGLGGVYANYYSNGENLYPYASLTILNNLTYPPGGYYNSATGEYRIRLRTGENPNSTNLIEVGTKPSGGILTTIQLNNVDGLKINGFTIRGTYNTIYALSGNDYLNITNNRIFGGQGDIGSIRTNTGTAGTITDNTISRGYTFAERWWELDKYSLDTETAGMYIQNPGNNWTIERNTMTGFFNVIAIITSSSTYGAGLKIRYNSLYNNSDDGIEMESYMCSPEIAYNNISEQYVAFSFSTATNNCAGRAQIHHNIVKNGKAISSTAPGQLNNRAPIFKVYNTDSLTNADIYNNHFIGATIVHNNGASRNLKNVSWFNNLFYQDTSATQMIRATGLESDGNYYNYNNYYSTLNGTIFTYINSYSTSTGYSTLASAKASANWPATWETNGLNTAPVFYDTTNYDYRLVQGQTLCTAANDSGPIGALPCTSVTNTAAPILYIQETTGTQIRINWTASTETRWNQTTIYLNDAYVTTTNDTTYLITGLTNQTTYTIRINATDKYIGTIGLGDNETVTTPGITDLIITNPSEGDEITGTLNAEWILASVNGTVFNNQTIKIINNENNTVYTLNQSYTGTSLNYDTTTSEWPTGNYTLRVEAYYNSTLYTFDEVDFFITSPNDYLTINVFKPDGTLATTNTFYDYTLLDTIIDDQYNSPIGYYLADGVYNNTHQFTITNNLAGAPTTINLTVNRLNTTFNVTLSNTYLIINFNGNTSGIVTDETGNTLFNNTGQLNYTIQEIINRNAEFIGVYFNLNNLTLNWSQFYETKITTEPITENITTTYGLNWFQYFKIYDLTRSPQKDAIIRMNCRNATTTWNNMTLIGQRITPDDGITFFWLQTGATCTISVTKDDKNPWTWTFIVGDESFTRDTPYTIYLYPSTSRNVDAQTKVYAPPIVWDTSAGTKIGIAVYNLLDENIKINTTYRVSQGSPPKTISTTCQAHVCYYNLTAGTDYETNTIDDIDFSVWIDNTYYNTYMIQYQTNQTTVIPQNNMAGSNEKLVNVIIWISLILISLAVALLFKTSDWGLMTFKFGTVIATYIQYQLGVTPVFGIVAGVYFIGIFIKQGIKRVIGEA